MIIRYLCLFLCCLTTPAQAVDTLQVTFQATAPDTHTITSRLLVAKDGAVWFGRRDGAIRHDGTHWVRYSAKDGLIDGPINTILQDSAENLWFGGSHQGQPAICKFDGQNWQIITVPNSLIQMPLTDGGCFDTDDNLWLRPTNSATTGIGTQNYGVLRFDGQNWTRFTQANGLAHDRVYDIQPDPDSGVWIATLAGVSRFDNNTWQTLMPKSRPDKIYRLFISQDGHLWATHGGSEGIAAFNGSTWKTYTKSDGLPIDHVRAIHQTPDGTLWFGTHPNDNQIGLLAFNNGKWKRQTLLDGESHHFQAYDIASSLSGDLYLTTPDLGLLKYRPSIDWSNQAISTDKHIRKSLPKVALVVGLTCATCFIFLYKRKTLLWHLLWHPSNTFQSASQMRDWSGPLLAILFFLNLASVPLWGNWSTTVLTHDNFLQNTGTYIAIILSIFIIYTIACTFRAGLIWSIARSLKHEVIFTQLFAVVGYAYVIEMLALTTISWGYMIFNAELPNHILAFHTFSQERPTSLGWLLFQVGDITTTSTITKFLYQIEFFGLWSLTLTILGVRMLYDFSTYRAIAVSLPFWIIISLMSFGDREISTLIAFIIGAIFIFLLILIPKQYRRLKEVETQLMQEMQNELQTAHDMQMRLMPETLPQIQGYDIAGQCVPANHVGGDFYQCYQQNGTLRLALADVTGHAMEAAIPVVMFSGILDAHVQRPQPLDNLFGELNQSLYRNLDTRTFVCFTMAELNIQSQTLRISNGGCPYPYHYQATTNNLTEIELDAYPLGVRPETVYEIQETQLQLGDCLIFCSDGIAEAENQAGEQIGFDRISQTILEACQQHLSAQQTIDHILGQVQQFMGEAPQSDDMTCIVLRVT